MGIRSRIKRRVEQWIGPPVEPPTRPVEQPRAPERPVATAPVAAPPAASPAASPPAPKGKDDPEVKAKFQKVFEKAKRGVLAHAIENGGAMSMADLHTFSERRYFIAHRSFSDLMGVWIDEGLVTYATDSGMVTLTDKGRAFAEPK